MKTVRRSSTLHREQSLCSLVDTLHRSNDLRGLFIDWLRFDFDIELIVIRLDFDSIRFRFGFDSIEVARSPKKLLTKNTGSGGGSGSVWANFGPKFLELKILIFKSFHCAASPPRRGPSSRRPEPRRPEGPRRSGDGRTNRIFLQKFFQNYDRNGILRI